MTNFKHLTQFELSAYQSDTLEKTARHEIGKHLLMCSDCRKSLPLPSVEKFWSAIMTENEPDENSRGKESGYRIAKLFNALPALIGRPDRLVLSGGALVVFLSLATLLWVNFGKSESEREISKIFIEDKDLRITRPIITPGVSDQASNNQPAISRTDRRIMLPSEKKMRTLPSEAKLDLKPRNNSDPAAKRKSVDQSNISSTRGAVLPPCEANSFFGGQAFPDGKNIILKWEKVANAAKYHLYISDEEEILIDEFETSEATSYILKKTLVAGKIYKWKVIVDLEVSNSSMRISFSSEI